MRKQLKIKINREFLRKNFPENISPSRKLSKKDKRFLQDKLVWFKKTKKKIKRLEQYLQQKANQDKAFKTKFSYKSRYCASASMILNRDTHGKKHSFLFSADQIRNDFLQTQTHNRPASDFLLKMKEKKKFSLLYGNVSRKFFQKAYLQATKRRGRINENLLIQFEKRLDILLYRICFAKTIAAARQYINHNIIYVNGLKTNISSYQVKPGDIISVDVNKKKRLVNRLLIDSKKTLNTRRFRFLISLKHLKKNLGVGVSSLSNKASLNDIKRLHGLNPSPFSLKTNRQFESSSVFAKQTRSDPVLNEKNRKFDRVIKNIKKIVGKVKKFLYTTKRRKTKKRLWFIETLLRLNNITRTIKETNFEFKKWRDSLAKENPAFLQEKRSNMFLQLMLKRLMYRKPSRYYVLSALRISPQKPLNVEISYKIMSAVILFPPQKIAFPATLNVDLLCRSISK